MPACNNFRAYKTWSYRRTSCFFPLSVPMILSFHLSLTAFAAFGHLSALSANALDVANTARRATEFTFNLFNGPTIQDETSTKSPSELDYTTGGGVPWVAVQCHCNVKARILRCIVVTLNPMKHNVSQKQGHCSSKTSIWRVTLHLLCRDLELKLRICQIESLAHFHRERIPERVSRIHTLDSPFHPILWFNE